MSNNQLKQAVLDDLRGLREQKERAFILEVIHSHFERLIEGSRKFPLGV